MINISKTDNKHNNNSRIKQQKKLSNVKKKGKSFQTELTSSIETEYTGSIEALLNDLKEREKKFLDIMSFYELNQYKSTVKSILKIIFNNSFQQDSLKKSMTDERLGRESKTIIRIIDEKLLELSGAIIKSNDAFDLMKTVEDIRGLIFDLIY